MVSNLFGRSRLLFFGLAFLFFGGFLESFFFLFDLCIELKPQELRHLFPARIDLLLEGCLLGDEVGFARVEVPGRNAEVLDEFAKSWFRLPLHFNKDAEEESET